MYLLAIYNVFFEEMFFRSSAHFWLGLFVLILSCLYILTRDILKEVGIPDPWPASWEICIQVRKQQLELDMEQQTGSK